MIRELEIYKKTNNITRYTEKETQREGESVCAFSSHSPKWTAIAALQKVYSVSEREIEGERRNHV